MKSPRQNLRNSGSPASRVDLGSSPEWAAEVAPAWVKSKSQAFQVSALITNYSRKDRPLFAPIWAQTRIWP